MFTGIVEEIGMVHALRRQKTAFAITIRARAILPETKVGDSIAVNGVCLTVSSINIEDFTADVMPETVHATNLTELHPNSPVNLERALVVGGRLGGHFVSGHIDGVGCVLSRTPRENAVVIRIGLKPSLLRYLVMKGSVAVDGTSLTIMDLDRESFSVSLIPHTRSLTILGDKMSGTKVNVECDLLGKYVEKFVSGPDATRSLNEKFLKSCGFS